MNLILSIFPAFAALRVRCAALEDKVRMLEDRALVADARTEDARRVADAAWRTLCGRSIYGLASEAMPLPPDYKPPQPGTGRRLAREAVAEQNAKAIKDWAKFFDQESAQ